MGIPALRPSFMVSTFQAEICFFLQGTEIKLTKGKYEVEKKAIGSPNYRVRTIGLYLVIESDIGVAVLWDRKTTVRIRLEPKHTVSNSNLLSIKVIKSESFRMLNRVINFRIKSTLR